MPVDDLEEEFESHNSLCSETGVLNKLKKNRLVFKGSGQSQVVLEPLTVSRVRNSATVSR